MALTRSPNPGLTSTVVNRLDALQAEVDHAYETGELRVDELQRLVAAITRETAIPNGLHAEKVRLGIVSPNVPKTPSNSFFA